MRKIIPGIFKKFRVFFILIFCSTAAFAQNTVSGKVTDGKTGAPAVGVTVSLKGTKTAVQTSGDGSFSIQAPVYATLVFTSIGFESAEVTATAAEMKVVLLPATASLAEVVVVGYGTQRKKEVTGAISKVSSEQITATAGPSFEAGLQGRVAGVQVSQSSGLAGSGSYVRIRGIASISAGGDPLYVIDGIPVSSDGLALEGLAATNGYKLRSGFTQSPLASINPDDIESIEILKDAGAAGIYGSRGANGVILVTTKRGKLGKPRFNFSTKIGFVKPSVKPDLLNSSEWIQLRQEAYENDGYTGQVPLPDNFPYAIANVTNTDWFDLLTQTGITQDYNLSMTYGKDKFRSYVGGTFGNDESYAIGNKFKRGSIRGNFDYTFSPRFKAQLNTSYSSGINYRVPSGWAGGIGSAMSDALPYFPVYKPDGSYDVIGRPNPLFAVKEHKFRSDDKRLLGGLALTFTPINNLDIKVQGNVDNYRNITDQFYNNRATGDTGSRNTNERWDTKIKNYQITGTASYNYTLNSNHSFTFLLGSEYQEAVTTTQNYWLNDLTVVAPFYEDEGQLDRALINYPKRFAGITKEDSMRADKWTFLSYFTRVNYNYLNKIFLQALLRIDGSSKFGPNNKFGFFPAVSAGYVVSDEAYMKNRKNISYLKIRASYGITGNAAIRSFAYQDSWNLGTPSNNGTYNGNNTLAQTIVSNPDLKWETANNFDAGIEFGLFKNRITGEIGYYNKLTKGVLMNVGLEEGYGIGAGSVYFANIGKIKNDGVEISLTGKIINRKNLTWSVFVNTAHNTNIVTDAGGYSPDQIQAGTNETRVLEGYPVGTSYTIIFKGIDPADGLPIWLGADGKLTKVFPDVADGRRPAGKLIPDWTGGFGTDLKWKGFEFKTLFVYSTGLQIWDNSGKKQFLGVSNGGRWNVRREFLDRWQNPGDVSQYPRMVYDKLYPGLGRVDDFSSTLFLYDADYLRMRELTLAYNFTGDYLSKIKVNSIRFFMTATNLFLWTKYKGGDPEVNRDADGGLTDRNMSPNVNYLTPPQAKVIQFGLNINF